MIKWPTSKTGNQQSITNADPAFTALTNHYLDLMNNLNSTQVNTNLYYFHATCRCLVKPIRFLFFWELMALCSFLLVMTEFEEQETQKAGILSFAMTQLST
jgi:hypothetical protein